MKTVFAGLAALGAVANGASLSSAFTNCLAKAKVPTVYPQDPAYANLTEPFNLRLQYKPVAVVYPKTVQNVQDAVKCASACNVKTQARSGGHSYASFSSGGKDGSLVINLEPFQDIKLGADNVAKVGGGVRLGNLAQGVWDQGKRAISHGTCPGVGIGGHFTHGGYGHTSRNWGIALDHIVGLDVVLADGSLVHASATENTDIFWALRGAAESFGIIVNFYLRTQAAPASVTYFSFRWGNKLFKNKVDFINTFLHIQEFSTNKSVVDNRISYGIYLDGVATYNLGGTFFGTPTEFNATISPELLRDIPAPVEIVVQDYNWIDYLILMSDKTDIREPLTGYDEHDTFFAKSITVPEKDKLSSQALSAFYELIKTGVEAPWFTIINLYGGPGSAINTKDTTFAAYSERDSLWVFQNYGQSPTDKSIPFINKINEVIIKAQPQTEFGAYLNYVDPSYSAAEAHELYYGQELYAKLAVLKKKFDPKQVFWNPQAIGA